MIEEMLHRNAMFCARHAEEIADVSFARVSSEDLGGGLWRVTAILKNARTMPSRSAMAGDHKMGTPDRLTISGSGLTVLTGGIQTDRFRPELAEPPARQPERLLLERGVPGLGSMTVTWVVRGQPGADFSIQFEAEKAHAATWSGELKAD